MSTNKTTRYKMHSWIGSDKVSRQEMVDNFTAIDNLMVANSTADTTYYVRPDGNDANTGTVNTAAGAFKTIGKAISMIPQVLNHQYNIKIANGTYNEDVTIDGFTGKGFIYLEGNTVSPGSCSVKSITAHQVTVYLNIAGFTVTGTAVSGYPVLVDRCRIAILSYINCTFVNTGIGGAIAVGASRVSVEQCQLAGKHAAVKAFQNSILFCRNNAGSGNQYAFTVLEGSTLNYVGTTPGYTSGFVYGENGGTVNPWGENSAWQRTYVVATANGTQVIPPGSTNTMIKVNLANELVDNLGEYDPTLSRYTYKGPSYGVVYVSAALCFNGLPANTNLAILIFKNGVQIAYLDERQIPLTNNWQSARGAQSFSMAPGEYLELYLSIDPVNTNLTVENGHTFMSIVRVN